MADSNDEQTLQAKAWSTMRILENQGYQLEGLSSIVAEISSDRAAELLDVLQCLAEDKQECSVTITRNSGLLCKVTTELEMQRKQNAS